MRHVLVGMVLLVSCATAARAQEAGSDDRVFGVLPNYGTVEHGAASNPVSARWMFDAVVKGTVDPCVLTFAGFTTAVGQGGSNSSFTKRYATSVADNAIGNIMTSALLPALLKEDPRYYQRGTGSNLGRLAYAATRIAVTRGSTGDREFNASELLGTLTAGAVANAYYPVHERSMSGTLSRWATQMAWDALANELKEFWPDIRDRVRRR